MTRRRTVTRSLAKEPDHLSAAMGKASNLVPLLVLFVFIAIAAFIGFIAYSVANDVSDKAAKRMEKKNIKFSKEGMKVGVKGVSTEDIADSTQS